jgi:hypothetical protein
MKGSFRRMRSGMSVKESGTMFSQKSLSFRPVRLLASIWGVVNDESHLRELTKFGL